MFSQTSAKLLLIVGVALCLYTAEISAESVCHKWWKTLPNGKGKMEIRLAKRASDPAVGRIKSGDLKVTTTTIAGGTGACGTTYGPKNMGGCLWGGANYLGDAPDKSLTLGWVNGSAKGNCGKKFFANRGDKRVEGTVYDTCSFDEGGRKLTIEQGCSTMYVTAALYNALGGTGGRIIIDDWDFKADTPPV
ncbi:hypothetical protein Pst134EA_005227 [Puccinia striiformis f. sp. tritici]|uniref:Secreted protein n=1 Tax=Puccinia striiformis f. sp. tritici PST-78 TaxID=1165861 RepID=A0A0L0VK75_9BASI|nr:hypothetical protein Pst134EA_005227 [Puccinia striiformis f. sp. tritici]KAH9471327.1 hypothetical protein Pst134EA_005227 [Puccinia striiformis f. sp. tritici]KNE99616.1 hypothetical protein PSTG_07109 [Puccinia striiformis f. sp. tritici PST-78]